MAGSEDEPQRYQDHVGRYQEKRRDDGREDRRTAGERHVADDDQHGRGCK